MLKISTENSPLLERKDLVRDFRTQKKNEIGLAIHLIFKRPFRFNMKINKLK